MFVPSSSWDDPPAHRKKKEDDGFLWKAPIALAGSAKDTERKRRRSVESLTFEPSALPELITVPLAITCPDIVVPAEVPDIKKKVVRPPPTAMKRQSKWIQESASVSLSDVVLPKSTVPSNDHVVAIVTGPTSPVSKKPRKTYTRPLKANPKPDTSINAASSNVVFQDLKMKGGTKSSRGAEALRRRMSRQKNDRWREANGVRRRGKKAATWRREQLGKEMRHERNLVDALTEESVAEMFSPGVDRAFIKTLAGVDVEEEEEEEEENHSVAEETKISDPTSAECLTAFLSKEFGHTQFRPGQMEAIQSVLLGNRSLIVLPTGAGKSLCYQFPSVYLRGFFPKKNRLTIVVSPLIALMTDQLKLLPHCARGAVLHSNMSPTQSHLVYTAIEKNQIDILFVAPERLLMYSMREILNKVFLVAVDEAHCLSEWSHTFRPAYLRLGKLIDEEIQPESLLALTATATMQTIESVSQVLSITNVIRTDRETTETTDGCVQRKNLSLFARRSGNPVMDFIEFLSQPDNSKMGPIIVYVQYKWQTENVSQVLRERGFGSAEAYHGGLSASERTEIHQKFMDNKIRFIVATIAFGMGIDKRNVRAVIHLTVPKSVEAYVQESGRAGRDGQPAICRCYFNGEDFARVRNRSVSDAIRVDAVTSVVNLVLMPEEKDMLFLPESIDGVCSKSQMSLILSLLEKEREDVIVYHGFPKVLKLRFFSTTIEELAKIDPIMDSVWHAPVKAEDTATENYGVVTIDTLKAIRNNPGMTPPQFMHTLSLAARAQKFAIAKSDWGHFVTSVHDAAAIDSIVGSIFNVAISSHLLEVNRLDASFALMSRIASESITDNPLVGHSLIQQYFEAEQRLADGEDLVPSILLGAKPGLAASVLREIDQIRGVN